MRNSAALWRSVKWVNLRYLRGRYSTSLYPIPYGGGIQLGVLLHCLICEREYLRHGT